MKGESIILFHTYTYHFKWVHINQELVNNICLTTSGRVTIDLYNNENLIIFGLIRGWITSPKGTLETTLRRQGVCKAHTLFVETLSSCIKSSMTLSVYAFPYFVAKLMVVVARSNVYADKCLIQWLVQILPDTIVLLVLWSNICCSV